MTVEEMKETLSRLGVEVISTRGDEIQGYCPAHEERTGKIDHNPSWWINADTGQHICFSCHFKGGLYTLISHVEKIEFDQARTWLGSTDSLMSRFNRILEDKKPALEETMVVSESMLKAFGAPPEHALYARGLTAEAAAKYELLWDYRGGNWITTIRNPLNNQLLGWQEKGFDRRHFKNQPAKVKKSQALFGYNQYKGGTMIVVESPMDVVRLASVGITGGVSTYGAIISVPQFNLLRGADRLLFALDNDDAGKASSLDMLSLCKDMGKEAWFFNYANTDMKDVGAMSKSEIESGIETAKHMARGKI
jgi:DNA primase